MGKYSAVIDMGSNSVRLVIYYEAAGGAVYEVDNIKNTIRLGAFLDENNDITEQGIQEAIRVLRQYRQLCQAREVSAVTGVATAAVRNARNCEAFLEQIYQETGFTLRVLSGEEEAYYGYLAVVNTMNITEALTVDIGGASSELVKISGRKLAESHSFPFGAVTLTRRFFGHFSPTEAEIAAMEEYLRKEFSAYSWIKEKKYPLIGIGGTVRNLGKVHQKMTRYPFPGLHYYQMKKYQVDSVYHYLRELSPAQMQNVEGLSKERADIIVAGISIIKILLEYIGTSKFIISNKGLRDGVYMEARLQARNLPLIEDVVEEGVAMFMANYNVNVLHARHVDSVCRTMFDQLARQGLHIYGEEERRLLSVAARLHDIGRMINLGEWQQHTFYLLMHVLLPGLTHREQLLTALIASYKGAKRLQRLVAPYESLVSEADLQMVEQLGLLLLMARALDRTESQQVSNVKLTREGKCVILRCQGVDERSLEAQTLEEHRKKFKKQFGIPLHVKWAKTP
ncbi:exopolyphosphatase [Aneurinibacillus thermoaerophilus]|uniref:Exopolyphosphatase n=1 Tax=Aneurinibacillus thermoaerophilus TaxID=143495 RepID=A0ABX8YAK6_ANETH|nr:exopolyphosphatase [Aneurinibacillus thermoaerophilus]QYY42144.1 exopolyphosphatase [Aneurinibacillus thermoaerophilus]